MATITKLETVINEIGTTKITLRMILVEYMCLLVIETEQVMEQVNPGW